MEIVREGVGLLGIISNEGAVSSDLLIGLVRGDGGELSSRWERLAWKSLARNRKSRWIVWLSPRFDDGAEKAFDEVLSIVILSRYWEQ